MTTGVDVSSIQDFVQCMHRLNTVTNSDNSARALDDVERSLWRLNARTMSASSGILLQSLSQYISSSNEHESARALHCFGTILTRSEGEPLPISFWPSAFGLLCSASRRIRDENQRQFAVQLIRRLIGHERTHRDGDGDKDRDGDGDGDGDGTKIQWFGDGAMYAQMRSMDFQRSLAHIVAALLDIINSENLRSLRICGAETLSELCECMGAQPIHAMVPGLVSGLVKTCCEDFKAGSSVLKAALKALTTVLNTTMKQEKPKKSEGAMQRLRQMVQRHNAIEKQVNAASEMNRGVAPDADDRDTKRDASASAVANCVAIAGHNAERKRPNAAAEMSEKSSASLSSDALKKASQLLLAVWNRRVLHATASSSPSLRLCLVGFAKVCLECGFDDVANAEFINGLLALAQDDNVSVQSQAVSALANVDISKHCDAEGLMKRVEALPSLLGSETLLPSLRALQTYVKLYAI